MGSMDLLDYVVVLPITIVIIVGMYQFYFWCQRQNWRTPIQLETRFDALFGFHPGWTWIYCGLYYPVIVLLILVVRDMRHYCYMTFSYIVLLLLHMAFFLIFPVSVPESWRDYAAGGGASKRLLQLVHRFDSCSN